MRGGKKLIYILCQEIGNYDDDSFSASSSSQFRFSLSSFQNPLFSCIPPNLSQKNNDLELIYRWIVVKFDHKVWNSFINIFTVGNFELMSEMREIHFAL